MVGSSIHLDLEQIRLIYFRDTISLSLYSRGPFSFFFFFSSFVAVAAFSIKLRDRNCEWVRENCGSGLILTGSRLKSTGSGSRLGLVQLLVGCSINQLNLFTRKILQKIKRQSEIVFESRFSGKPDPNLTFQKKRNQMFFF